VNRTNSYVRCVPSFPPLQKSRILLATRVRQLATPYHRRRPTPDATSGKCGYRLLQPHASSSLARKTAKMSERRPVQCKSKKLCRIVQTRGHRIGTNCFLFLSTSPGRRWASTTSRSCPPVILSFFIGRRSYKVIQTRECMRSFPD
jgi:hypothetical protein